MRSALNQKSAAKPARVAIETKTEAFTVNLPDWIALRLRLTAAWYQITPEQLIAESITSSTAATLADVGESAQKTESKDIAAAVAANAAEGVHRG